MPRNIAASACRMTRALRQRSCRWHNKAVDVVAILRSVMLRVTALFCGAARTPSVVCRHAPVKGRGEARYYARLNKIALHARRPAHGVQPPARVVSATTRFFDAQSAAARGNREKMMRRRADCWLIYTHAATRAMQARKPKSSIMS